ncbi:P-loop containing nucleoside triphosphate hydrolase protein [Daedaleopsis nitida]|nr:P-loop containing nucleoside triphosphate hydrolase protein [Daedaleopsis nitida]
MSHDEQLAHGKEHTDGERQLDELPTSRQEQHAATSPAADSSSPPNPDPEPTPATTSTESESPIFIIVMGVAGTGKTTLARALEARLRLPYIEGDALHPAANVAKMSAGTPLTDADREPWLELIRTTAEHMCAAQQHDGDEPRGPRPRRPGVLATCSALRGYYRDILRGTRAPPGLQLPEHLEPAAPHRLPTFFVYIKGDRALLMDRISKREGHFMKSTMLESQLQTLESPEGEDGVVVVPMEASTEEQTDIAIRELNKLLPEPLHDHAVESTCGKD